MRKSLSKINLKLTTFLVVIFFGANTFAQTNQTHLSWSTEVGCVDFANDKVKGVNQVGESTYITLENLEDSFCIRVCEDMTVTYNINGQNITNTEWSVTGGVILSSTSLNEITVKWGTYGSGSLSINIFYEDGTFETQSICVEKIHKPKAIIGNNSEKGIRACINTPIYFDNQSITNGGTAIVHYNWDFGDNTPNATQFEPTHSFSEPGTYEVELTVINECNCQDKTVVRVEIIDTSPVTISCPSVTCENSTEIYTVNGNCSGEWSVEGGEILSTEDNQVEVKWNHVNPNDGFGYVNYKSDCECITSIKVPVIINEAYIKGERSICVNKQYKYTLPQWPTTLFRWYLINLNGGNNGEIIRTPNRNEIYIKASEPGAYRLSVHPYENTFIGCKGSTFLELEVGEPVEIRSSSNEICEGNTQTFTVNPNTPVQWKVTKQNSIIFESSSPSPNFSYNFEEAGLYLITAKKPNGCEGEPFILNVAPTPVSPSGTISGETHVCANIPYTYSLSNVDNGVVPVWEVENGVIQGNNTGQSIIVMFNEDISNFSVSVRNQSSTPVGCLSQPISLQIEKQVVSANISSNPAPTNGGFCPSSTVTFTADIGDISPDNVEWEFPPFQTNFGSFAAQGIDSSGNQYVTINFNEISNSNTSILFLKVTVCGETTTFEHEVTLKQLPVLTFNDIQNICLGGDDELTFNVTTSGNVTSGDLLFTFSNGSTHTETLEASGIYTFNNNNYIQNNSGVNITENVVVTLSTPSLCDYEATANQDFLIYPEAEINITPGYNYSICDPSNYSPITLNANTSTGITQSAVFTWYKNGTAVGTNQNSYTISGNNPYGIYYVETEDINGCLVRSRKISVNNNNCDNEECIISPNPQLELTAEWTACGEITATASFPGNTSPTNIEWICPTANISSVNNNQPGTSIATYTTDIVGAHGIIVMLTYGDCVRARVVEVQKRYKPEFSLTQTCNANGTFDITLLNNSSIFGIDENQIGFNFFVNGGNQQTGQEVTYTNLSPGTYNFELQLSSQGNPLCSLVQSYTIDTVPTTSFTASPLQEEYCEGEVINITVDNYNSENIYELSFAGTSFIMSSPSTEITINSQTNTGIKLFVKTPQGCVFESDVWNIEIKEKDLSSILISPPSINTCEGGNIEPLVYQGTGMQYIWMNMNEVVSNAPNSATFTPTEAGYYWPIIINENGCENKEMAAHGAPVVIKPLPFVNIQGNAGMCVEQSTVLRGIITNNELQHRWLMDGVAVQGAAGSWSTDAETLAYTVSGLAAGTYVFTLEASPVGIDSCVGSRSFSLTVYDVPEEPTISYEIINCNPFTLRLTASGPSEGQYLWSNGMQGQSIQVNYGGIYGVSYTAPTGCVVENEATMPHSLESLMWVFPTGCYNVCPKENNYLVGPLGFYASHAWMWFDSVAQGYNTLDMVYPFWPKYAGIYQLTISDGTCTYTSGELNYTPDEEGCGYDYDCKIKAHIKTVKLDHEPPYHVYGIIHNDSENAITLNLSSPEGVFYPSTVTIPSGGAFDFMSTPILFYPIDGFTGGFGTIIIQNPEIENCREKFEVKFPNFSPDNSYARMDTTNSLSKLIASPNPVKDHVTIQYNTGETNQKARSINVRDIYGSVIYQKELNSSGGALDIPTQTWKLGTYTVILETPLQPLQVKLLKK